MAFVCGGRIEITRRLDHSQPGSRIGLAPQDTSRAFSTTRQGFPSERIVGDRGFEAEEHQEALASIGKTHPGDA